MTTKATDNEAFAKMMQREAGMPPAEQDGWAGAGTVRRVQAWIASLKGGTADTRPPDVNQPGRLSPHFTLAEFTTSQAAARLGLSNQPDAAALQVLKETAQRMEEVRTMLGNRPILISSVYRSDAVNRAVGGSKTSAHRTGHAVDFTCPAFGTPAQVAAHLAKNLKGFDQIIEEFGSWVHVGFGPGKRGQLLTARKVNGVTRYTQGIAS